MSASRFDSILSRRQLLAISGMGLGTLALAGILGDEGLLAATPEQQASGDLRSKRGHFPAPAKAVIMLMQNGGPSQMDLFDPKPELKRREGEVYGTKVEMFQTGSESNKLLGSPFKFHPRGQCGMELSEIIPHIGTIADDVCLVRSMVSEHNNHTEALVLMNTGKVFPGRPAIGSWISYALGSENQNLPAYIVLRDPDGYNTSGTLLWQNGWIGAQHRGTEVSTKGAPVLNLSREEPISPAAQRRNLDFLARLNQEHYERNQQESELEARIRNYELAARMQLAAGAALDLGAETEGTKKLYGLDNPETQGYGTRLLMARRLVELGVRFVQVMPPIKPQFQPWDAHGNVKTDNEAICAKTDLPSAALVKDLKLRGLLDSTIVLWTGEFGRLPVSQNGSGRDHNRNAFSLLLAGGGFKTGHVHGATDEVGYRSVDKRVTVADLHATILNQLGLDHNRLTYRHHGRDETLTDSVVTGARVVDELLEGSARST